MSYKRLTLSERARIEVLRQENYSLIYMLHVN
ncbi:transposase [Staphylococcus schweitzeri]|nr:transposase [Staphylococcus schweitzeri]CDR53643.1 transposase [Staphylococcus schweitzeri]CDR65383.1 transposase [Staphylococcus schweitzeri]VEE65822.1 Uncharacterised protein [Staphylococcus schweitzeri]